METEYFFFFLSPVYRYICDVGFKEEDDEEVFLHSCDVGAWVRLPIINIFWRREGIRIQWHKQEDAGKNTTERRGGCEALYIHAIK